MSRTTRPLGRALLAALLLALGSCATIQRTFFDRGYDLEVRGNDSLGTGALTGAAVDELAEYGRTRDRSSADDVAYAVESYYRSRGFPFATVEYWTWGSEVSERPRLVLEVDEGPRTELGTVSVTGNQRYSGDELREFFGGPTEGVFGTGDVLFTRAAVAEGVGRVRTAYRDDGFLEVSTTEPRVTFSEDRTRADITFEVREGPRYVVRSIALEGELGEERAAVEQRVADELGRPFSRRLAREVQGRVSSWYADRGHADVEVELTEIEEERVEPPPDAAAPVEVAIALDYRVAPGPVVRIADVVVRGAEVTNESFVRSRIELAPGERWSREKESDSFAELYETGVFSLVEVTLDPDAPPDAEERDLIVRLEESPRSEVFLEPGWGSYERARLTVGGTRRNVFGSGRLVRGQATFGELAQFGRIDLIDPWFLKRDLVGEIGLIGTRREEPSFLRKELGVGTAVKKRWSSTFQTTVGWDYRRSDAEDVEVGAIDEDDIPSDLDLSYLHFTPTYDTRDGFFEPTQGNLSRVTFQLGSAALGSQLEFFRMVVTQANFLSLDERTVLGAALRTGLIWPIGASSSIPIQERFFNGGERSVRSFEQDQLGPLDPISGEATGGETTSTFTLELRRGLIGSLSGAAFWDIGNVTATTGEYLDFPDLRQAVGIGLRYGLPIGPVRLDWGINPDPRGDERDWTLHFSLGMSF